MMPYITDVSLSLNGNNPGSSPPLRIQHWIHVLAQGLIETFASKSRLGAQ